MNAAILVSGRGSNMVSLVERQHEGYFDQLRFTLCLSNKTSAPALEKAQTLGLATEVIDHKKYRTREEFDAAVVEVLKQLGIEWVVLAGFMRIITPVLLDAFPQRVVNIHPALLPAFPGMNAQQQAFDYGVKISGVTVHFVDSGVDTGPIIAQQAVDVSEATSGHDLQARMMPVEHELFARALKRVTEEPWHIEGRQVVFG